MNNIVSQKESQFSSLGTITKSHSLSACNPCGVDVSRVQDFILQDIAGDVLKKKFRVQICLKRKIDRNKLVNVCFNESTSKAHYGNVIRCGSVWVCPVCAKKITEFRKNELKQITEKWISGITIKKLESKPKDFIGPKNLLIGNSIDKGHLYLLTLTMPHYSFQSLSLLKEKLKIASTYFFGGKNNEKMFQNQLGKHFHVKNTEVTYGQNGWHPHHHILIFSDKYLSIKEFSKIRDDLADHWSKSLHHAGIRKLKGDEKYIACDLQDGTYASDYVAKWGIESELTKGHIKKGRDSFTPFDFLRLIESDSKAFDKDPSDLFREFADAFKGVPQLSYSRSCKFAHSLEDKDDDEIMNQTLDEAIFLRDVDDYAFKLICKHKKRAQFLDLVTQDFLTGSSLSDALINELSNFEKHIFDNEIKHVMNLNSDALINTPIVKDPIPWISSNEYLWMQNFKDLEIKKDIDESVLLVIAEHLAWLDIQRE